MGLAALAGGHIIGRDAQGLVQHYWFAALLGASASVLAILVARRLDFHQSVVLSNPPAKALAPSAV